MTTEYSTPPNTIERLAEELQNLDNHPLVSTCVNITENGNWIIGPSCDKFEELSQDLQDLLNRIDELACGELITSNGEGNWFNNSKLKRLGYPVTPGETDSFGLLSACIHLKNGIFVYG